MKKILACTLAFLLCWTLILPLVYADGMILVLPDDNWKLFDEEKQNCAINYKDGIQSMILEVSMGKELEGEQAVWLFPIPAAPEKTVVDIIKGFPAPEGITL